MRQFRNLITLIVVLVMSTSVAYACSCVKRSDAQSFTDAQAVVVGVISETRYIEDQKVFGGGYIRAVVDVRETLKGQVGHRLEVIDQVPEAGMCSSFLRAGVEYVLFVDERQEVGMCSGTHPLGATFYDRPEKLRELQRLKSRAEP